MGCVSLEEARAQLNQCFASPDDDLKLEGLILAAEQHLENLTGRNFSEKTEWIRIEREKGEIRRKHCLNLYFALDCYPIREVCCVEELEDDQGDQDDQDDQDAWRSLEKGCDWRVIGNECRTLVIQSRCAQSWRALVKCGYSCEDFPAPLKQAILLLISHWYMHPVASEKERLYHIPFGVNNLISPYKTQLLF